MHNRKKAGAKVGGDDEVGKYAGRHLAGVVQEDHCDDAEHEGGKLAAAATKFGYYIRHTFSCQDGLHFEHEGAQVTPAQDLSRQACVVQGGDCAAMGSDRCRTARSSEGLQTW